MLSRKLAEQAVEAAIKAALAVVRPYVSDKDTLRGVSEGLRAASPYLDAIHKE